MCRTVVVDKRIKELWAEIENVDGMKDIDNQIELLSEKMVQCDPKNWSQLAFFANADMIVLQHQRRYYKGLDPIGWKKARKAFRRYSHQEDACHALRLGADFYDVLDKLSGYLHWRRSVRQISRNLRESLCPWLNSLYPQSV